MYALDELGSAPITTRAVPTSRPTVVSLHGREVLKTYLKNGTWELVFESGRYYFSCDTEGVKVELPQLGAQVVGTVVSGISEEPEVLSQPFAYPKAFSVLMLQSP